MKEWMTLNSLNAAFFLLLEVQTIGVCKNIWSISQIIGLMIYCSKFNLILKKTLRSQFNFFNKVNVGNNIKNKMSIINISKGLLKIEYKSFKNKRRSIGKLKRCQALCLMVANNASYGNWRVIKRLKQIT